MKLDWKPVGVDHWGARIRRTSFYISPNSVLGGFNLFRNGRLVKGRLPTLRAAQDHAQKIAIVAIKPVP